MKKIFQLTQDQKLEFGKAIKHYGSCQKMANDIGVHLNTVNRWASGKTQIDVEACMCLDKTTKGQVNRYTLRPDVNW